MAKAFSIGDAVQCHPGVYEHAYGIGLIVDKNPKYWFVQFTNGEMIAFRSTQLRNISS